MQRRALVRWTGGRRGVLPGCFPSPAPGSMASKNICRRGANACSMRQRSVSGYHMAVVAGVVFFVFRAGLALIPGIALRHPIKKWGALAALLAATFYLVLSGAEVATQRSFIMIGI